MKRGWLLALVAALGAAVAIRAWGYLGLDARFGESRSTAAFAWAGAALAYPWVRRAPKRAFRLLATGGLLVLAFLSVRLETRYYLNDLGSPDQLKTWRVFHYYLGSKYFDELGYDGLYVEALKAEREGANRFAKLDEYRDMHDYRFRPTSEVRFRPRSERWTDARWEEFRADVDYLVALESDRFWAIGPLLDRGYNPPPAWTAMGGVFTRRLSIRSAPSQTVLVLLDALLLLAALALSWRAFGLDRSLFVLGGVFLWYGSMKTLLGGIWFVDWLAALWIAASLLRLGRFASGGAAAAYAASVRVFPAALWFGPCVIAVYGAWRRSPLARPAWRFLLGVAAALVVIFVVAGLLNGHGFHAYVEFAESIRVHLAHHDSGERRVGLGHLLAMDWRSGLAGSFQPGPDEGTPVAFRALQAVLVGLLGVLVARKPPLDGFLLGIPLVFIGVVSSRYYGAMLPLMMLLPGLGAARDPSAASAGSFPTWVIAPFFVLLGVVRAVELESGARETYLLGNLLVAAWLTLTVVSQWPRRPVVTAAGAPA